MCKNPDHLRLVSDNSDLFPPKVPEISRMQADYNNARLIQEAIEAMGPADPIFFDLQGISDMQTAFNQARLIRELRGILDDSDLVSFDDLQSGPHF